MWHCQTCGVAVGLFEDYCNGCWKDEDRQTEQPTESSAVNHPKHYNQIKGVECIDVAEKMCFNLGNALKYIWRCHDKGKKTEDLRKAIWYIDREIKRTEREA